MKTFLMHPDRDFDLEAEPLPGEADLIADLGLETLFDAMADGDPLLRRVARRAVLSRPCPLPTVLYRQEVLRDCLANRSVVRGLYDLAGEAIEEEKKHYWGLFSRHPSSILRRSVEVLDMLLTMLRRLRRVAEAHGANVRSAGLRTLFAMLWRELDDAYLGVLEAHLARLKFRRGLLVSARLGIGNVGTGYALRKPNEAGRPRLRRLFSSGSRAYTFQIAERDESGARAVAELRDRGLNIVANAAAQSSDHILSFFHLLRTELAFYVGCLNLHETISAKREPSCFPEPVAPARRQHHARGLYDLSLALRFDRPVVGNDLDGEGRDLFVITGANQGGKSTFLRSLGLAQLMMQCGMFVPAQVFRANLCAGLFTHFKREEDPSMQHGKLEEELKRVSDIVPHLAPDSFVLFNESFQATNEREGSQIGRQIVDALVESRIKVCFVTHMYDLAGSLFARGGENVLFLRAERHADGTRTFKIRDGSPLPTSHGKDLYQEVFGTAPTVGDDRGDGARDRNPVAETARERDSMPDVVGTASRLGEEA